MSPLALVVLVVAVAVALAPIAMAWRGEQVMAARVVHGIDRGSAALQGAETFTSSVRIGSTVSPLTTVHRSPTALAFWFRIPPYRGGYELSRAAVDGLVVRPSFPGCVLVPRLNGKLEKGVVFPVAGSRANWEERLADWGWLAA